MRAYVDAGAGMAEDGWSAAWTFDLEHWGVCGQGPDDDAALTDLAERCGLDVGALDVVERVDRAASGDETVFERDTLPASEAERAATLAVLGRARSRTLALVRSAPRSVLDHRDPGRQLPAYASWHTVEQLAFHIADTESRYYLPLLGLPARERADDVVTELEESGAHVRRAVEALAPGLATTWPEHGSWTSVKVLRRLAWHERGELDVLARLVDQAVENPG